MNVEETNLMWFVALPETFVDYDVTASGTALASGKVMIHVSQCGTMAIRHSGDSRVQGYDEEGIKLYLECFDDYAGNTEGGI